MLSLAELERRFVAALAPGEGDAHGPLDPDFRSLIDGDGALDADARIRIYADMYRARLVDVLREDYPRLASLLGCDAFAALAARYLAAHPSRHPSVRYVGDRFAAWLGTRDDVPPYAADLARLEWARVDAFDAADAAPARLVDLQPIPQDEWPALRFCPIPACRVVESAWPIHEIWAAGDPDAETSHAEWVPSPTVVRVWREEFAVTHAAMGEDEQRAFAALARGESFAEICAAIERGLDADAAAHQVGAILLRWLEDGLLVTVSR